MKGTLAIKTPFVEAVVSIKRLLNNKGVKNKNTINNYDITIKEYREAKYGIKPDVEMKKDKLLVGLQ